MRLCWRNRLKFPVLNLEEEHLDQFNNTLLSFCSLTVLVLIQVHYVEKYNQNVLKKYHI